MSALIPPCIFLALPGAGYLYLGVIWRDDSLLATGGCCVMFLLAIMGLASNWNVTNRYK